jgi:hypothetical protein
MLNKSLNKSQGIHQPAASAIPDPWDAEAKASPKPTHPSWQFPLDPQHELAAAPAPDGILSPQGDPNVMQIPAHVGRPAVSPTEALLSDELKVDAQQYRTLWEKMRDALTLLWWQRNAAESSARE